MVENEENTIQAVATDIAQVVEKAAETQKAASVQFVKVQRLQETEYKDPTPEQYHIEKHNHIGTPLSRETKEAIAMVHQAIHSTGHMPLW